MKRMLLVVLVSISFISFGDMTEFKNFNGKFSTTVYSFELLKKITSKAGYFHICWFQLDTEIKSYGSSLTSRGGGGGRVGRVQHRSTGRLDKTVIIVGYDLSNMADHNTIQLKDGQILYKIGIHTNAKGFTFEVYSLNQKEKPDLYLNSNRPSSRTKKLSRNVCCPYCGKKLMLVPSRD